MEKTVVTAGLFKLDWRDLAKGLIIAILAPVIPIVKSSLDAGTLTFDWNAIGIAALGGFVAYLLKNLFTPEQVITTKNPIIPEKP